MTLILNQPDFKMTLNTIIKKHIEFQKRLHKYNNIICKVKSSIPQNTCIQKSFSGIYFYPLNVLTQHGEMLYKIGRAKDIADRIKQEASETTCTCNPYDSPETMCYIIDNLKKTNDIETYIKKQLKPKQWMNKEIYLDITFKQVCDIIENNFITCHHDSLPFKYIKNDTWQDISRGIHNNAYIHKGHKQPKTNENINRCGEIHRCKQFIKKHLKIKHSIKINNSKYNKILPSILEIQFDRKERGIISKHKYSMKHIKNDFEEKYLMTSYETFEDKLFDIKTSPIPSRCLESQNKYKKYLIQLTLPDTLVDKFASSNIL